MGGETRCLERDGAGLNWVIQHGWNLGIDNNRSARYLKRSSGFTPSPVLTCNSFRWGYPRRCLTKLREDCGKALVSIIVERQPCHAASGTWCTIHLEPCASLWGGLDWYHRAASYSFLLLLRQLHEQLWVESLKGHANTSLSTSFLRSCMS